MTQLPRPQAPMVDRAGQPTREWYDYLRIALTATDDAAIQAQIAATLARIDELEEAGTAEIRGPESVLVSGTLAGGLVQLRLVGDTPSPAVDSYYGTDSSGVQGYHVLPDPSANWDGGNASSVYGGTTAIDGGGA